MRSRRKPFRTRSITRAASTSRWSRRSARGPCSIVSSVTTKGRKRNPSPPFITSKLQQTARFPVKKTMMLAQQLYEGGIEIPGLTGGLITYMRTDSVRVADDAIADVRQFVKTTFGDDYLPEKPNFYKTKS